MRRFLLTIFAVALALTAVSQEQYRRMDELYSRAQSLAKEHKFVKAASCLQEAARVCYTLPDSLQQTFSMTNYITGIHYNRACYLSLAGRRKAAVNAFLEYADALIGNAEADYAYICTDTDLDPIRDDKRFIAAMQRLKEWCDYKTILQQAAAYAPACTDSLPAITYANPNDSNLVRLRLTYNLDSIAGAGNEISKMINLMTWVHNTVPHDGGSSWPEVRTAEAMIELCRKEGRGVNCRMLAMILNECYLSMGFKSRYITCMPKVMVRDCHVINAVYSATLDKWIWMDPSFNAYVMDADGTPLSIDEVRECIRTGKECYLNDDANWNNRHKETKEHYIDYYMAKNLYYLEVASNNIYGPEWHHEGHPGQSYIVLVPEGDDLDRYFRTTDAEWFWQSPYK